MKQYRQGDVLIECITEIPKQIKPQRLKRVVLAHGEVTGHAHELRSAKSGRISAAVATDQFRLAGDMDDLRGLQSMALAVDSPDEIVHQEHAPISLKKGVHRVTRQREYSPEAIRNVAD